MKKKGVLVKLDIKNKILELLYESSSVDLITVDSRLREDIGFDSLDMVTLLINIEEHFGIELDESDMNPFDLEKADDVIRMVKKYFCEDLKSEAENGL